MYFTLHTRYKAILDHQQKLQRPTCPLPSTKTLHESIEYRNYYSWSSIRIINDVKDIIIRCLKRGRGSSKHQKNTETRRVFNRRQQRRRINWIKLNAKIKRSLVAAQWSAIVFVTITYPIVSSIVRERALRQRVLCVWQLRWMTLLPVSSEHYLRRSNGNMCAASIAL